MVCGFGDMACGLIRDFSRDIVVVDELHISELTSKARRAGAETRRIKTLSRAIWLSPCH